MEASKDISDAAESRTEPSMQPLADPAQAPDGDRSSEQDVAGTSSSSGTDLKPVSRRPKARPRLVKLIMTIAKVVLAVEGARFVIDRCANTMRAIERRRWYYGSYTESSEVDEALETLVDYLRGDGDVEALQRLGADRIRDAMNNMDSEVLEDLGVEDPKTFKATLQDFAQKLIQQKDDQEDGHQQQEQQQQVAKQQQEQHEQQLQQQQPLQEHLPEQEAAPAIASEDKNGQQ